MDLNREISILKGQIETLQADNEEMKADYKETQKHWQLTILQQGAECAEQVNKLQAENDRLRKMLEKIAYPFDTLKQQAKYQGMDFVPIVAIALQNDANWLRGLAEDALKGGS